MAKLTALTDISNISGAPTAAETAINNNSDSITTAFNNTLSRDGSSPNSMGANLDMNENRVVNMQDGVNPQDGVTVSQLTDGVAQSLENILVEGTNITIENDTPSAGQITISAAGGGAPAKVGEFTIGSPVNSIAGGTIANILFALGAVCTATNDEVEFIIYGESANTSGSTRTVDLVVEAPTENLVLATFSVPHNSVNVWVIKVRMIRTGATTAIFHAEIIMSADQNIVGTPQYAANGYPISWTWASEQVGVTVTASHSVDNGLFITQAYSGRVVELLATP